MSVSTHSRPKAAGWSKSKTRPELPKFQHTAARRRLARYPSHDLSRCRRFNTQPPEGGWENILRFVNYNDSFNTQPPEGGWTFTFSVSFIIFLFQHTAARRRLGRLRLCLAYLHGFNTQPPEGGWPYRHCQRLFSRRFNTQPPEGGCFRSASTVPVTLVSTHSRLKAAESISKLSFIPGGFNTQPPEGGCSTRHKAAQA